MKNAMSIRTVTSTPRIRGRAAARRVPGEAPTSRGARVLVGVERPKTAFVGTDPVDDGGLVCFAGRGRRPSAVLLGAAGECTFGGVVLQRGAGRLRDALHDSPPSWSKA